MKLTLEKADVIALIGKALGRELNEENVEVHLETFEVIIHDASTILVPPKPAPVEAEVPQKSSPSAAEKDPPLSMDELLNASKQLAQSRPQVGRDAKRGSPKARGKIPGEYDEPLPPVDPMTGGDDE